MTKLSDDPAVIAALIAKCPITLEMSARRVWSDRLDDAKRNDPNHKETHKEVCDQWEHTLKDCWDFNAYMDKHAADVADWLQTMRRVMDDPLYPTRKNRLK